MTEIPIVIANAVTRSSLDSSATPQNDNLVIPSETRNQALASRVTKPPIVIASEAWRSSLDSSATPQNDNLVIPSETRNQALASRVTKPPIVIANAVTRSSQVEAYEGKTRIKRVHLEEDTGKSLHEGKKTLLDFNKSGMALVEIVTEPDFHDIREAVDFSKMIQKISRALGVSDCDMEKGQMRIEANISVREKGLNELPNYRVEVKNINSFKFLEKAVNYEFERQSKILEKGETIVQENRGFDDKKVITISQRQKEEESEYRYFPEPDMPPFEFSEEYVDELKGKIPELPNKKIERYINDLGLSESSAEILTETPEISLKFEEVAKVTNTRDASNILVNKLEFREKSVGEIIDYIKEINTKEFLNETETLKIVEGVLEENEKAVEDFKKGNENSVMFLLGACMKKGQGKIDAQKTKALIIKLLWN